MKKKKFEEENGEHDFDKKKKIIIILIANFGYKRGELPFRFVHSICERITRRESLRDFKSLKL